MKKTKQILIAVAILLIAATQSSIAQTLKELAKQANSQCPIQASEEFTITKVKAEGNTLNYYNTVKRSNGSNATFQSIKNNPAQQKATVLINYHTLDKDLIDYYVENKIDVKYTYTDEGDPKSVATILLSTDEMRKASRYELPADEMLSQMVAIMKTALPIEMRKGYSKTNLELDAKNVITTYTIDEDQYDMDKLEPYMQSDEYKEGILSPMKTNNILNILLHYIANSNRGVMEKIVGNKTNRAIIISVTPEEVKAALK